MDRVAAAKPPGNGRRFYDIVSKVISLVEPRDRITAAYLVGGMVVSCALELLGIGLIFPVLWLVVRADHDNTVLASLRNVLGLQSTQQLIVAAIGLLCASYIIKDIFRAFLLDRLIRYAFGLRAKINFALLRKYLDHSWLFHTRVNSAELIRNLTSETYALNAYVFQPSVLALAEGLLLVGILMALLFVDPWPTLVIVATFGLSAGIFMRATRHKTQKIGIHRQLYSGQSLKALHHAFHAIKDIKILGVEQSFALAYEEAKSRYLDAERREVFFDLLPAMWIELCLVVSLTAAVVIMLAQGRDIAGLLPVLGVFGGAALRLMPSIARILRAFQDIHFGLAAVDVIAADLKRKEEEWPSVGAPRQRRGSEAGACLAAHEISFAFNRAKPVLAELSLTISKGEAIGVFGPSGAGKSTFVDLMLGLVAPCAGEIVFHGTALGEDLRSYRRRVGYVPQSIYLLDETIRKNVAFGVPESEIDDAAVWRALEIAQLKTLVHSLERGLDSPVGEHGVCLSGGQRQRLGIARALYRDPEVLFLDEVTSALDPRTEAEFMDTIRSLRGSKAIVVVAHRSSTLKFCDRVFELRDGRLIQHERDPPLARQTA
jgi:ABC-type multidrug transport system fused ATPase/permease subunit